MKEVQAHCGTLFFVDEEDYDKVKKYSWVLIDKHVYSHQLVQFLHNFLVKAPPGLEVDHIDRNGLNNCKNNYRFLTRSHNQFNRGLPKHNTSGYKGVSFKKATGKWIAYIRIDYKLKTLGSFLTREEAALAYNTAARSLIGEAAYLNQI